MNKLIHLSGNLILFFIAINFYIFVVAALLSGDYSLNVYFNGFGEGPIECIIYMFLLPIILYATFVNIHNFVIDKKIKNVNKKGKNLIYE